MAVKIVKASYGRMQVTHESGWKKTYFIDEVPKSVWRWLDKNPKIEARVCGALLDDMNGQDRVRGYKYSFQDEYRDILKAHCVNNTYFAERKIVEVRMYGTWNYVFVVDSCGGSNQTCLHELCDDAVTWLDEHVEEATKIYDTYKKLAKEYCEGYIKKGFDDLLWSMCRDLWFIEDQEAKIVAAGRGRKENSAWALSI